MHRLRTLKIHEWLQKRDHNTDLPIREFGPFIWIGDRHFGQSLVSINKKQCPAEMPIFNQKLTLEEPDAHRVFIVLLLLPFAHQRALKWFMPRLETLKAKHRLT